MRIRAVTAGHRQTSRIDFGLLGKAGALCADARSAFETAGYEVQTLRLATQQLSQLARGLGLDEVVALAERLEAAVTAEGIDYCSLGPVVAAGHDGPHPLIPTVPAVLRATRSIFVTVALAKSRSGINLAAVMQAAEALVEIGRGDQQATTSRRFAVSANVPPNGPFFPSAHHRGRPGFSLAIEGADLAVDAFTDAPDLATAGDRLRRSLEEHGRKLVSVANGLAEKHDAVFHGLDISPAPFPEAGAGIAEAMERLGVGSYGGNGTLFASAFLVDTLRSVDLPTCGFSGLMIPLVEDATMAARHAEGAFNLDSLLLYSAVCGAGLDTIPIPGDATVDQIAAAYLDLCTLAVALKKPLTARLMPIPGKQAGDPVEFDFRYFAPTTVVGLRGAGSPGLFGRGDLEAGVTLISRPRRATP